MYYAKDSTMRLIAVVDGHFPSVTMKQACMEEYVYLSGRADAFIHAVFGAKTDRVNRNAFGMYNQAQ